MLEGLEFELKNVTDDTFSTETFGKTNTRPLEEFNFTRGTRMMGIETFYDPIDHLYKAWPIQMKPSCTPENHLLSPPTTEIEVESEPPTPVIEDKSTLPIAEILIPLAVLLFVCVLILILACKKKSKKQEASVTHGIDGPSDLDNSRTPVVVSKVQPTVST